MTNEIVMTEVERLDGQWKIEMSDFDILNCWSTQHNDNRVGN